MNLIKKLAVFSIIALFVGCGSGIGPDSGSDSSDPGQASTAGTLEINIADAMDESKLMGPTWMDGTFMPYDMMTNQYEIIITGPRPGHPENMHIRVIDNVDPMVNPAGELFENLYYGEWNVVVNARNADAAPVVGAAHGAIIGTGTSQVIVNPWLDDALVPGETPNVTVVVAPIPGIGDLLVSVGWNQLVTWDPVLNSYLVNAFGAVTPLITAIDPAMGGVITNMDPMTLLPPTPTYATLIPIANGYYTLVTELREHDDAADPGGTYDEEYLVAGFAEIVRIVTGQVTVGNVQFGDSINPHYGDFIVDIDMDMKEPIILTLSGDTPALVEQGQSMTTNVAINAAATVPAVTQAMTYYWYENGQFQGAGPSVTLTADMLPTIDNGDAIPDLEQHYRVDVIGYQTDGTRAGSASYTYTVTESLTPNRTITAFDIAGQEAATVIATDLGTNTGTIDVTMPYGTAVTALVPTITTDGAKEVAPASGVAQDFTGSIAYTVSPYDPTVSDCVYTATVTVAPNHDADIVSLDALGYAGLVTEGAPSTVLVTVPGGTDVSAVTPAIVVSPGATYSPVGAVDFAAPVAYTVTAMDGVTAKIYMVTVAPPAPPVVITGTLIGAAGTGCEDYEAPHPTVGMAPLCCSPGSGSTTSPKCSDMALADIPCLVEFTYCDDGTMSKTWDAVPTEGLPGHTTATGTFSYAGVELTQSFADAMTVTGPEIHSAAVRYSDGVDMLIKMNDVKQDVPNALALAGDYSGALDVTINVMGGMLWMHIITATDITVNLDYSWSGTSVEDSECTTTSAMCDPAMFGDPNGGIVSASTPISGSITPPGTIVELGGEYILPIDSIGAFGAFTRVP